MELAAQLLEITNDAELDQFIGRQLQSAARAAGSVLPPPVLQPLSRALKATLKHTLRIVGDGSEAVASNTGGHGDPSLAVAANTFALELEGLSPEDQEFEVARRFVRLTRSAGRRAPRFVRRFPARVAARRTLVSAARRHAPGLLRRRRRRFRRRAPRFIAPVPVVYPDPEPLVPAAIDPEPDPEPGPEPEPAADTGADADANADADPNASADAEPAAEEASPLGSSSYRRVNHPSRYRPRHSGSWVRVGGKIILRDV
jgi:hypothetical protein